MHTIICLRLGRERRTNSDGKRDSSDRQQATAPLGRQRISGNAGHHRRRRGLRKRRPAIRASSSSSSLCSLLVAARRRQRRDSPRALHGAGQPLVLLLVAAHEAVRAGGLGLLARDHRAKPGVVEDLLGRRPVLRVSGEEPPHEVLALGGDVAKHLERSGGEETTGMNKKRPKPCW